MQMHSTKISGLAVDTEYTFHLVLRTTAGTYTSDRVAVRTHKMTDLSGITITTGILPASARESLAGAVERIGARLTDTVRIDTTHFVTTEGRGVAWEKAVEGNIPVVRPEWVEACEKTGRILGVTKYYLDAMRPGPIETHSQPAAPAPKPQVEKELPAAPAAAPESPEKKSEEEKKEEEKQEEAAEENGSGEEKQKEKEEEEEKEDEKEGENEDEKEEEGEQKTMAGEAEQKMRVEDKESQKVALRPAPAEDKSSDGESEAEGRDPPAKPGVTPDGASFQEVEL